MKARRIKQMVCLERGLRADGYDVTIRIHAVKNALMFSIKLKDNNEKEILDKWDSNMGKLGG